MHEEVQRVRRSYPGQVHLQGLSRYGLAWTLSQGTYARSIDQLWGGTEDSRSKFVKT